MAFATTADYTQIPENPAGGDWFAAWASHDGRGIYADSITEIVDEVLPDQAGEIDDGERLLQRAAALEHLGGAAQVNMLAQTDDVDTFTEDELTALLTPKQLPVDAGVWSRDVPLVLVATNFHPFTDVPAPTGTVLWLDPSTELTFLNGLEALGFGELYLRA